MTVMHWVHRINRATTLPPFLIAAVVGSYAVFIIAAIMVPPLSRWGYQVPDTVLLVGSLSVGAAIAYGTWKRSRRV